MLHDEFLAHAAEYHSGVLSDKERARVDRHLAGCRDCRILYGRWVTASPSTTFLEKVMARLEGLPIGRVIPENPWLRRLALWGTVAAAVFAGAAFWHPEKQWMESDALFAWSNVGASEVPHHPAAREIRERGLP
jgi:anti-sigma factor RsiW